jgi:hypothetical protein
MNRILLQDELFITLFCVIDDLCKALLPRKLSTSKGRDPILNYPELMTIGVYFCLSNTAAFKGFYRLFLSNKYFTSLPEYSRLLRNVKVVCFDVVLMMRIISAINCSLDKGGIKIIDSVPLPVVSNKRIFGYSVSELAARGRSSMGWYYGFKLHLIIDLKGNVLRFEITPGNVSDKDRELMLHLCQGLKGLMVGDKGYLSRELKEILAEGDLVFQTGLRKGMKSLATVTYHTNMKLRQFIETTFGRIKFRQGCVSSLPRSVNGYFFRYAMSLFAYVLLVQFI